MADRDAYSKREVSRSGQHLAHRLMQQREGLRPLVVDPDDPEDRRARDVLEWWRAEHLVPMVNVHQVVKALTAPFGIEDVPTSYRPKRVGTIIEKLTREPGKLADMVDIGGVRAVLGAQGDVDDLHGELAAELDIRRVRDWTRNPRATGYRAVHLHVRDRGHMIEVQLRTFGQDAWANVVEEESRLSGVNYKAGEGHRSVLEFFRAVADFMAVIELGEEHPDMSDRLSSAYHGARSHLRMPTLRQP